jgi:hypothetical protein
MLKVQIHSSNLSDYILILNITLSGKYNFPTFVLKRISYYNCEAILLLSMISTKTIDKYTDINTFIDSIKWQL